MKYIVLTLIMALGVPAMATPQIYVWNNQTHLIPAENCAFSTEHLVRPAFKIEGIKSALKINGLLASIPGIIRWEAKLANEFQVELICPKKTYIVFELYSSESPNPIAEVALDPSEPELLMQASQIETLVIDKASMDLPEGVPFSINGLDYKVCNKGKKIEVLDQNLSKVIFSANDGESMRPVQSFGNDHQTIPVGGVITNYTKVQFNSRPAGKNIGWISDGNLKTSSQCDDVLQKKSSAVALNGDTWNFPTNIRPTDSYKTGMRRFSAARSGGARLHAACDLYRTTNEEALSVSSGQVIRDRYYFYQGTYAIEVLHPGGKIARYGEITGKSAPGVKLNAVIKPAQTIGYIGKVNSNCCSPMLHFEFYSGTATGPLSQPGNKFQRRKDLLDPTEILSVWEKLKFGISF